MSQETPTGEEVEGTDESTPEFTSETAYGVLSDKRRRYAIHYLKQVEGSVTVRELAEQVAAWENDKDIPQITSQERKRVYIALYQSHLPTLHKEGIVEYDSDRGVVTLTDAMATRTIYLEVVPKGNIPWSLFYVGLVMLNSVLLLLAWLEVYPFSTVPDLIWGVVVLTTFALSAFVQTFQNRRMRLGDEGPPPELR